MKKIRRINPIVLVIISLAVSGVSIAFASSITLTPGSSPLAGYRANPMVGYTMGPVTWVYAGTTGDSTITSVSFTLTNDNTDNLQDVTHDNTEVNVRLVSGTSNWFTCTGVTTGVPNRFTCDIQDSVNTFDVNTFDVTAYSK